MSANRSLILRENKLAFWTYKRHDNKSQHLFIRAVPSKENIAVVINGYEKSIDIVIQTGSWCYNNTIYDSARQLLENRSGLDNPQKCSLKKIGRRNQEEPLSPSCLRTCRRNRLHTDFQTRNHSTLRKRC